VDVPPHNAHRNFASDTPLQSPFDQQEDWPMGKGILLWLLGVPIPIIILLALFWH